MVKELALLGLIRGFSFRFLAFVGVLFTFIVTDLYGHVSGHCLFSAESSSQLYQRYVLIERNFSFFLSSSCTPILNLEGVGYL